MLNINSHLIYTFYLFFFFEAYCNKILFSYWKQYLVDISYVSFKNLVMS